MPGDDFAQKAAMLAQQGLVSDEAMQKIQDPNSFLNPMPGVPGGVPARAARAPKPAPKSPLEDFADRVKASVAKVPDTAPFQGKVAIGSVYDQYKADNPRGFEPEGTFGHRLVNAAKARHLDLSRNDLPEYMDRDLRVRSATNWGDDQVHFVNRPTE